MNKDIDKFMKEKMSSLEIVTSKKQSGSQDSNTEARRSTLDLPEVQKKFSTAASVTVRSSASGAADFSANVSNNIKMAVVRPKSTSQDSVSKSDERTLIFNNGKLYGSQG